MGGLVSDFEAVRTESSDRDAPRRYGTHLLLSLCYSRSFPRWTWWLCHGCALVVAVVCGEFLCARNELKEIPLAVVPGERTPKAER